MPLDAYGVLLLAVMCAVLGFIVGWMGGKAEGRAQERGPVGEPGDPTYGVEPTRGGQQ